jgi:REP element-mobilizing transposase RayT
MHGDNKPHACVGMKRSQAMSDPLAYFLTWTTYGTWLPGDARGWVKRRGKSEGIVEAPSAALESHARSLMNDPPVVLDAKMRDADAAMRQACRESGWNLHALEVRSNHVHIVVTACDASPGKVMGVLKVRGTQGLNALGGERDRWWARNGSKRILDSSASVEAAIRYVNVMRQDERRG